MKKHLDLGCGSHPRNPYEADHLYGVDIRSGLGDNIASANLAVQPIPFSDNYFSSVSAYDFLEHVPRLVLDVSSKTSIFPFIDLMNEVWRVLEPGGRFYAVTPAYPSYKAFVDPTHVNFVAKKTHEYFVGVMPLGRMYGFIGYFELIRAQRIRPRVVYEPSHPAWYQRVERLKDQITLRCSHVMWEFSKKTGSHDWSSDEKKL